MKKILAGAVVAATTLVVPGAIGIAEGQPLPGRRPPCSIVRESPLEASVGTALCQNPASVSNPAAG